MQHIAQKNKVPVVKNPTTVVKADVKATHTVPNAQTNANPSTITKTRISCCAEEKEVRDARACRIKMNADAMR